LKKKIPELGVDPIGKLLIQLSIPATIGMVVNAMYNFVDTIFVGRSAGPMAIAGLTIAFPIQMLLSGFAQTYGVGGASIVSRRLGEKRDVEAASVAGTALTASFFTALLLAILGLLFLEPLLKAFGSSENILPFAREYMSVIFLGTPFLAVAMTGNNLSRAEGQAKIAMMTMIIGTGLNILLDPFFIFFLGLGIRGAAIATVLSQLCAFIYIVYFYKRGGSHLPLKRSSFVLKFKIYKEIVLLGIPTLVRQAGTSILAIVINNSLRFYGGDISIAAYGMINRLLMFVFMPLFGIVQGYQPIAGFNFGAKKYKRLAEINKLSFAVTTIMSLFGFAVLQILPRFLMEMFTTDRELINVSVDAVRKMTVALPFIGIQVIGATYFQSVGKAGPALWLGLSRQFVFLIPLVLILPPFWLVNGIWFATPIADILSTLMTVIWFVYSWKKMERELLHLSF
jgi:putative MATE family efflux protein